ncbi:hypothetical protein [Bacillus toyonensis]|uniref:hypothetical protein n=1 Tax=Bacillus toyonensis TaxID=155322 RepID=UPI00124CD218|nr:hypothetical protein [Bacillus toyonensis]KAB2380221.1 hypothetical protein F8507_27450 [Bacillus toyonensis]
MGKQYKYKAIDMYKMVTHAPSFITESTGDIDTTKLTEMSLNGWELVCTTSTQLIFKKEVI